MKQLRKQIKLRVLLLFLFESICILKRVLYYTYKKKALELGPSVSSVQIN